LLDEPQVVRIPSVETLELEDPETRFVEEFRIG